jgi:hypothetical protein
MTLLEALHTSRRRLAAREIHRYRHLMDEANAAEIRHRIARAHAKASPRGYSPAAATPAHSARRPAWPLAMLLNRIRMWAHAARHLVPQEPRAQAQGRLGQ